MAKGEQQPISPRKLAGWVFLSMMTVGLIWAAGLVFLLGLPYYLTPAEIRADHPYDEMLGAGRFVGLLLGIAGTALMTVLLLYSVRKWLTFLSFMGSSQFWMRFHMVCGLLGPLYILLHAELKMPQGFIAIGFWCMMFVALSGFFGRYLFGYFPATAADLKLDLKLAQRQLTELRAQLVADTRDANRAQVQQAVRLAQGMHFEPQSLGELIILDADVRRRADLIHIMLVRAGMPKQARRRAEQTLVQQLELKRSMAGFDVARRLLRYWSLFHQPLAAAMYLVVFIHIASALFFGGAIGTLLGGF